MNDRQASQSIHRPSAQFCKWTFALLPALLIAIFCGPQSLHAQSVLVWATGNGPGLGDTPGVAAWLQASGEFTSVTGIDSDATLPLAQLLAYDRLLFFTNSTLSGDAVAIGDVLADFADTGRRLVLATFSWANQGFNTLAGRIIDDQISPYVLDGPSLYTNVTIQSDDGSALFDGVNSINGFYHDDVALTPGALEHGRWSDGSSLAASKGNVIAVNLFPDDFAGQVGGDHRQLFVNALAVPMPVPEPSAWMLSIVGLTLLRVRGRLSRPAIRRIRESSR